MQTLRQVVKELRKLGHSQLALSKVAGVSQMTISRWEKASPGKLINLAALRRLTRMLEKAKAGADK